VPDGNEHSNSEHEKLQNELTGRLEDGLRNAAGRGAHACGRRLDSVPVGAFIGNL